MCRLCGSDDAAVGRLFTGPSRTSAPAGVLTVRCATPCQVAIKTSERFATPTSAIEARLPQAAWPTLAKFPLLFMIFDPLPSADNENTARYGDCAPGDCSSA